jgi:hypothetical protein
MAARLGQFVDFQPGLVSSKKSSTRTRIKPVRLSESYDIAEHLTTCTTQLILLNDAFRVQVKGLLKGFLVDAQILTGLHLRRVLYSFPDFAQIIGRGCDCLNPEGIFSNTIKDTMNLRLQIR